MIYRYDKKWKRDIFVGISKWKASYTRRHLINTKYDRMGMKRREIFCEMERLLSHLYHLL